ncbi:hypothetical protein LguiB_031158 [Lonicera macranthoides]
MFAASGIIHTLASHAPSLIRQDVSARVAIEDHEEVEWDHHGLPVGKMFQLSKLSGGYTKAQLQKELKNLHTCGLFKKVNVEGKYNPDGSIGLTVSFVGSTWEVPERVKCINVGLMPQAGEQKEMQVAYMNKEELQEYMRFQKWDYERRMESSRPCLLPGNVLREVSDMLRREGNLTAQLMLKIQGRVQKWYRDQGFACAQVVNFGNLNTQEIVFEVVEGDITGLVVQFQDKHGNVCEGNKQFGMLQEGNVFNLEAAKQALRNLNSLALFSNIELGPRPDEKNEGGVIVEIKF